MTQTELHLQYLQSGFGEARAAGGQRGHLHAGFRGSPRGLFSCCGLGLQAAYLAWQGLSGREAGPQQVCLARPWAGLQLTPQELEGVGGLGNVSLQLELAGLAAKE